MKQLRTRLVDAGLISAFDLAPGFPGVMPRGFQIIERFRALYRDQLAERMPVGGAASPLLEDPEVYRADYGVTYDYTNTFELRHGGRSSVVRPDSLTYMIKQAVESGTAGALVCADPLFRSESNPAPLVRDKHIWGVLQVIQHGAEEGPESLDVHAEVVLGLLSTLLVPTLLVEAPPLREHAERRLLTFSRTRSGELWLTSTVYAIAEPLAKRLGATGRVLEVGITAKIVALAALLHEDTAGLRLPSALAPAQVQLTDPAQAAMLNAAGVRAEVREQPFDTGVRQSRRQGTPLLLGGNRLYRRSCNRWEDLAGTLFTPELAEKELAAHDAVLRSDAEHAQEGLFGDGGNGQAWLAGPTATVEAPGHVIGTVVDANFPLGRQAAIDNALLVATKRRIY